MARKRKSRTDAFDSWPKPDISEVVKTNKDFESRYQMAISYAHFELSPIDLKKETIKYLKGIDLEHPLLAKVKDMNENRFVTVGKYMYILNHGGDVPDNISVSLMPALEKIINEDQEKTFAPSGKRPSETSNTIKKGDETLAKVTTTIQDRLESKAREVAGELEGWIDDFCSDKSSSIKTVEEFVNLFKINQLKAAHMRHMQNIFGYRAEEIEAVLEGTDKDLVEGYSNFTKLELKKLDQFYKNLLKACGMLQEVAKVERAPRKKKPVSLEKVVSRLKYKKEDSTLGIVSLNPVNIPGAREVWVYNTKTRKLSQYKASGEQGLGVKGAGIIDYAIDSIEKTLRKPAEALAEFKKASKVKLRTFLKDLSTVDVPCGGKMNEHCVILRIDK